MRLSGRRWPGAVHTGWDSDAERVINTGRHLKVEPERIPLQCSSCWDPPHDCCGPIPDGFG
jgi:hypothetical protein